MSDASNDVLEWPGARLDFSGGTVVMAVLNVTPDSFSDGGRFLDSDAAIEQGLKMAAAGAAIIDVGPESTRPGAKPVSSAEQINRALPVVETLSKSCDAVISIDTHDVEVAAAALNAGASMVNDITALTDKRMAELTAAKAVPVVLMHMQKTPETMQVEPRYENVVAEVRKYLLERAAGAERLGIPRERIFIDPGIGFGKTVEHNLLLLRNIDKFVETGYRVLVGTSRKSFIGRITGKQNPAERLFGTAATVALCTAAGVSIVRVHDVAQMMDVVKLAAAVAGRRGKAVDMIKE